jgi:hypothetical protein
MAAKRSAEAPHLRILTCLCHSSHFQEIRGSSGLVSALFRAQGDKRLFRDDRRLGRVGRPLSRWQSGGKGVSPLGKP